MSGCRGVGGPDPRKLERAFGLGEAEGTRPLPYAIDRRGAHMNALLHASRGLKLFRPSVGRGVLGRLLQRTAA